MHHPSTTMSSTSSSSDDFCPLPYHQQQGGFDCDEAEQACVMSSNDQPLDLFDQVVDSILEAQGELMMRDNVDSLDSLLLSEDSLGDTLVLVSEGMNPVPVPTYSGIKRRFSLQHNIVPVLVSSFQVNQANDSSLLPKAKKAKKQTPGKKKTKKTKKQKKQEEQEGAMKKPKRSLSAYNLFFQAERAKLLKELPDPQEGDKPRKSHGKLGFAQMAKIISQRWKDITPQDKIEFEYLSAVDGERYEREMAVWKKWNAEQELLFWRKSQEKLALERSLGSTQ